ncbi:hypothetical protein Hanom_Chr12g01076671 [Helianthus anomalus]
MPTTLCPLAPCFHSSDYFDFPEAKTVVLPTLPLLLRFLLVAIQDFQLAGQFPQKKMA